MSKFAEHYPDVFKLVDTQPGDAATRGVIRARCKQVLPLDLMGNRTAMLEWLEVNAVPKDAAGVPISKPKERTIDVDVEHTEEENGRVSYSVLLTQSRRVKVPISVAEEGEDAIRKYIEEALSNGDSDYSDYEYGNHRADQTETIDDNIESCVDHVMDELENIHNED